MSGAPYPATGPEGCFSSSGAMKFSQYINLDTSLECRNNCIAKQMAVAGMTNRFDCWCGSKYPPQHSKVEMSQCNSPCPAYPNESCGAPNLWTVWSTGLEESPGFSTDGSNSTSSQPSSISSSDGSNSDSTSTSIAPSTVVQQGSTIVMTIAPTSSDSSQNSGSSTGTKVGTAVGVVLGVLAIAGLIAGVYFFLKRRKRLSEEGHHRRNSSLNGFINGDRHPPAYALNDSRLDPSLMVERRQSTGSMFADNQDYSRRILKVTNPDGT